MVVSWLPVMRASRSCEYTMASTLLSCRAISSPTLHPSGAALDTAGEGGRVRAMETIAACQNCACRTPVFAATRQSDKFILGYLGLKPHGAKHMFRQGTMHCANAAQRGAELSLPAVGSGLCIMLFQASNTPR